MSSDKKVSRQGSSEMSASSSIGTTPSLAPVTPQTTPSTTRSTGLSGLESGHSTTSLGSYSSRGSSSSRGTLPSPSRSRLDPEYAARLAQYHQQQLDAELMPPPSIARGSGHSSIFRPTPVGTPRGSLASSSGSSLGSRSSSFSSFSSASKYKSSGYSNLMHPTKGVGRFTTRYGKNLMHGDRFIPSRATSNMSFSLWEDPAKQSLNSNARGSSRAGATSPSGQSDATATTRTVDTANQSQPTLLQSLLRSELLGENLDPAPTNYNIFNRGQPGQASTPLREGGNHLRFQSPRQAYQSSLYEDESDPTAAVNSFGLSPIASPVSQRLMSTPQKRKRRIQKVPFKVLDAPALQDDFYLNLVDWSSQNVLAVGLGACVYLWSACTSKVTKLCDFTQAEDLVTSVSWAQRGAHLAVGTNKGEVQIWDTHKCKKIRTMSGHSARIGALSWSGPMLASGSRDRLVYLRDVRIHPQYTARLSCHKQEVCGLKWSFDEPANLASGGNDNKLLVWDIKNNSQPIHRFAEHTAAVKAIAWSPHQHGLLTSGGGTADRCIRFWNTLNGASLNCIDTGSQVCNLAWSKNCNEIVSTHGYSLNQIVVWRYPSMSKVATLTGHTYRVLYLSVSPDGSTIVTGAGDETLRFWQVFPGPRSNDKNTANGLLFPATTGSVIR